MRRICRLAWTARACDSALVSPSGGRARFAVVISFSATGANLQGWADLGNAVAAATKALASGMPLV